jgi:hypothetical protein
MIGRRRTFSTLVLQSNTPKVPWMIKHDMFMEQLFVMKNFSKGIRKFASQRRSVTGKNDEFHRSTRLRDGRRCHISPHFLKEEQYLSTRPK